MIAGDQRKSAIDTLGIDEPHRIHSAFKSNFNGQRPTMIKKMTNKKIDDDDRLKAVIHCHYSSKTSNENRFYKNEKTLIIRLALLLLLLFCADEDNKNKFIDDDRLVNDETIVRRSRFYPAQRQTQNDFNFVANLVYV